MKTITTIALLLAVTLGLAQAEPREKREHHNYIIERQETGQVQGPPIIRRYTGGRVIDVYRDGSMFEKNNFVGYDRR